MASETVIPFRDPSLLWEDRLPVRSRHVDYTGATRSTGTQDDYHESILKKPPSGTLAAPIAIDKLYPVLVGAPSSDLSRALELLADAIACVQDARAARKTDPIASDRFLLRFQKRLPELFARRGVGDGFAVVINALHFAFINLHGKLPELDQITTIWRVLKELRSRPFTLFADALSYVAELEEAGLQVDPPIISELCEDLAHE